MPNGVTLTEEFERNKELKQEDLDTLKDWCSKQPHLPAISDERLAVFLHSCYFRLEPTKATIDNYYTVRTHVPELFWGRDPYKTNIWKGGHVGRYFVLPHATPEGFKIFYMDYENLDPAAFDFQDTLRLFTLVSDVFLHTNGTFPGFLILFNMAGLTLVHMAKLSAVLMGKMLYYLQEAMPVRLQGIHYVNAVPFMDTMLSMMRPFMKKELTAMLHIHTNATEKLYKTMPKGILPAELGGEEDSVSKLHGDYMKMVEGYKDWITKEEKLQVDEQKRPGKPKNAGDFFGIEGSFKKLDID